MMAVPFIFSIFLGAMLVMLFPFPLITSTSGLAGAAAIGKRQGRDSSADDEGEDTNLLQLLNYIAGPDGSLLDSTPTPSHHYHQQQQQQFPFFKETPPLSPKIKVRKRKVKKFPVYQKPPSRDSCSEKVACEIGRSAGRDLRTVLDEYVFCIYEVTITFANNNC
jgi:hypothetical protein